MTDFEAGDVVRVLFPHVERNIRRPRPALVVTHRPIGPDDSSLIWAIMITNAARAGWPGDVLIDDHEAVGLPVPSVARTAKIATFEARSATRLGRIDDETLTSVNRQLQAYLRG